jgi:hypothetical protein
MEIDANMPSLRTSEYMPDNSPLVTSFLNKFGGDFSATIFGTVIYEDKNYIRYAVKGTKTDFFDRLSKSIKTNKNLFITTPFEEAPEGALI